MGLFGKQERICCPHCLEAVKVSPQKPRETQCDSCKYILPLEYVRDYKKAPPVFVQMFGGSQVGKTTFLDVLRLHLYYMDKIWPNSVAEPITELDRRHKAILVKERNEGLPPGATPRKNRQETEVYLMKLNNMERWGSRYLAVMDYAGEYFEKFKVPAQEIPFLLGTPTTIMLISLQDLQSGYAFDDSILVYIRALTNLGVDFKRRHLIIVLSKADLIPNLPQHLSEYLQSDNLGDILPPNASSVSLEGVKLPEYLERMQRASDATAEWIDKFVDRGRAGLQLLKNDNIDARFVLISSTGQDLTGTTGNVRLAPRRVLDPFFWSLEFQSRE